MDKVSKPPGTLDLVVIGVPLPRSQIFDGSRFLIFCATKRTADELTRNLREVS